jgi:hypothetical protein
MTRYPTLFVLAMLLAVSRTVTAAALDDIKVEVSHDPCGGAGADAKSVIVYATNLNSIQAIDATFKYDSNPAQQHFILFDADLNPITDRFPNSHARRLSPHEIAAIGCTYTYRAAPKPPGPLAIPIVIAKQSATYVADNAAEAPVEDARSFAAFILQGGINECAAGAKPPGLFYLVNLHPYARLAASMNLLDDHGAHVGNLSPNLSPWSATRVGCSNGFSKPGPITDATLEIAPGVAAAQAGPTLAPLSLGAILTAQNVCAGAVPAGWIKINDAWNPTVCGNPATVTYNVWTIQQLSDQPPGAVIYACKGAAPLGWAIVGSAWNPTVCGRPTTNQANVMAIKRLN